MATQSKELKHIKTDISQYFLSFIICIIVAACQTSSSKEELSYYQNGNIKTKVNLLYGKRNGKMYEYYEDGKIKSISEWLQGKANGSIIHYYPNGQVESSSFWVDSLAHDSAKSFYQNGQLKAINYYKKGHLLGNSLYYYPNGVLMEKQIYSDNGNLVYYAKYDKNGKLKDEMVIPIIEALKDTINLGEEYRGTITFGLGLVGDINIYTGVFKNDELIDTTAVLKEDSKNVFSFSTFPSKRGSNTFTILVSHKNNSIDSLSVDGVLRTHRYYVR